MTFAVWTVFVDAVKNGRISVNPCCDISGTPYRQSLKKPLGFVAIMRIKVRLIFSALIMPRR